MPNEFVARNGLIARSDSQISGSATRVTGSVIVTGSVSSTLFGFTGSLLGTASYVSGNVHTGTNPALTASFAITASYAVTASYASSSISASYYQLVTGSTGTDFNIVPTLSGSFINIPDASTTTARGLVNTGQQIFGGLKAFQQIALGGNTSVQQSNLYTQGAIGEPFSLPGDPFLFDRLVGGTGANANIRLYSGADTATVLTNNESYATFLLGASRITEGTAGSHPLIAQLAIRPMSMSNGSATTDNYASLYIEQPLSGSNIPEVTNIYAIWVDSGSVRFDGDLIMSQSNVIVTGSVRSSGGFTGSLFGTASYVTGSIYVAGNLATSASWAATASFLVGGSGLKTKSSGSLASTFGGNPKTSSVVFTTAFTDNNYSVVVTGEDARTWTIETKSATGFTINSNSNLTLAGTTYWKATAFGES